MNETKACMLNFIQYATSNYTLVIIQTIVWYHWTNDT